MISLIKSGSWWFALMVSVFWILSLANAPLEGIALLAAWLFLGMQIGQFIVITRLVLRMRETKKAASTDSQTSVKSTLPN